MLIWVYAPCNIGGINQDFGENYCVLKMEVVASSETLTYKARRSTSECSPWKLQISYFYRERTGTLYP